jgi:hypothetical protein
VRWGYCAELGQVIAQLQTLDERMASVEEADASMMPLLSMPSARTQR